MRNSAFAILVLLTACNHKLPEPAQPITQPCAASYSSDIKPVIKDKCAISGCHGSSGLADLSDYTLLKERADNGNIKKYVFTLGIMPPSSATALSDNEKKILQCWLDNGAKNN